LVRDVVIARVFGAGLATDAFFVAFRIPNLLRRLFAEGAFSQVFVPVLGEYRAVRGHAETKLLVDHVGTFLATVLIGVSALGVVAAPLIIYITAPGFSADVGKFELTVALLRLTFPYILFISLTSLAGGILNTWSRFSIPAFTPTLLNLSFIVFALWLAPYFEPPVMALAWAVFCGGLLQLAMQIPFLLKIRMLPRPAWQPRDDGVQRILRLMGPAVLGVSVAQVSLLINTIFASFLATGSVTWLYYADRLMELPVGLLGVALGTVLLPNLSRRYADGSAEEYARLLDWGLRLTVLLAAPCAVALAVLALPILATLFKHGAFAAHDVLQTRQALIAYSVGLVALVLVKILAPAFYARQNVKTPVKIAVITLLATQLMNLTFIWTLRHAGLALAIALAAWVNAGLLYWKLRQHGIFTPVAGWPLFLLKVLLALAVMAVVLLWSAAGSEFWLQSGVWQRIERLAFVIVAGAASYLTMLWLSGFRPADFSKHVS
jgi:putative peptidoglycan lipid II flippase